MGNHYEEDNPVKLTWSKDWPTEPGRYWFYGVSHKCSTENLLRPAEVRKISNGIMYIADGAFIYKEDGAVGWWAPLVEPELPIIEVVNGQT